MIKTITFNFLLVFTCSITLAQNAEGVKHIETVKKELINSKVDTNRVLQYVDLCTAYQWTNSDSLQRYSEKGITLAQQLNYPGGEVRILNSQGIALFFQGNIPKALEILFKGLRIAEKNNLPLETAICLNNAFYAVTEKAKQNVRDYEPTVSLRTRRLQDKIEINVRDNGNGIPASIKEKIFQPFFTTKPTGQGTGLGLSLAYDIVKAHGGEIKVETKEGEGTEFTIHLQNHATQ